MTDREVMKQALQALEWATDQIEPESEFNCQCPLCKAIDALQARLAQPEVQQRVGTAAECRSNDPERMCADCGCWKRVKAVRRSWA
jgi:hypothetical protein